MYHHDLWYFGSDDHCEMTRKYACRYAVYQPLATYKTIYCKTLLRLHPIVGSGSSLMDGFTMVHQLVRPQVLIWRHRRAIGLFQVLWHLHGLGDCGKLGHSSALPWRARKTLFLWGNLSKASGPLTRWWMKTPLLTERVVDHCKGWTCRVWVVVHCWDRSWPKTRSIAHRISQVRLMQSRDVYTYWRIHVFSAETWLVAGIWGECRCQMLSWVPWTMHHGRCFVTLDFQIGSVYSWFGVPDLGGMSNMIWPGSITVHLLRYAQSFQDCPVSFLAAWVTPRIRVCVYNVLSTFRYINLSKL